MIAGEGLVGILLALLAVVKVNSIFDLSRFVPELVFKLGGVVLLIIIILTILGYTLKEKDENEKGKLSR